MNLPRAFELIYDKVVSKRYDDNLLDMIFKVNKELIRLYRMFRTSHHHKKQLDIAMRLMEIFKKAIYSDTHVDSIQMRFVRKHYPSTTELFKELDAWVGTKVANQKIDLKHVYRVLDAFGRIEQSEELLRLMREDRKLYFSWLDKAWKELMKSEDLLMKGPYNKSVNQRRVKNYLGLAQELVDFIFPNMLKNKKHDFRGLARKIITAKQKLRSFEREVLGTRKQQQRLFASKKISSNYGRDLNIDSSALEAAMWANWDQSRFVASFIHKAIDTARGAKNPREAKRYLDKLAEREGVNREVVEGLMDILDPPRGRRASCKKKVVLTS